MKYKNYIELFLKEITITKNLSEKTIKAYRSDINNFILFVKDTISKNSVIGYFEYLSKDKELKDSSIKRKLITLKQFTQFLQMKKVIKSNPFKEIKFRLKKTVQIT